MKWHQFQKNGVVRDLKNRDGWAYLWNKQMNSPLVPTPSLSNFNKLKKSGGIKSYKELKIRQINYEKTFNGGEKLVNYNLKIF